MIIIDPCEIMSWVVTASDFEVETNTYELIEGAEGDGVSFPCFEGVVEI